jgi:uncharacterized protein
MKDQSFDRKAAEPNLAFDVVLKLAERCNLACPYCYYFHQSYDGNSLTARMSDAVIEEIPRFLQRSMEQTNIRRFGIVLHGGEPLLLKREKVDHLCTLIREVVEGKIDFRIAVQTNGTLINDDWVDLFCKHNITVGISIDGPRELHDSKRPDHHGRGSYDGAVRGLRLVQKAVAEGRLKSVGALAVLHVSDESEKLLEHLVYTLGINTPNLNFPRAGWDVDTAREWNKGVESHRKVVRYWLENLIDPDFHFVRGISDVLFALNSDKGALRNDARSSSRHCIATISSAGLLHVDDNLLGVDKRMSTTDLSIFGTSLADLIRSPLWQELNEAVDHCAECEDCEWYRSCRGGDLWNRISNSTFARKSSICETIQMIHEEVTAYLLDNNLVTVDELAERLAAPVRITARDTLDALLRREPLALAS